VRGVPRQAAHLPHQPLDAARLQERRRRLRGRIRRVLVAVQGDQTGDLVLLGLGVVDAPAAAGRARAQPPAVHLDGDGRRGFRDGEHPLPPPPLLGFIVTDGGQFGADGVGQLLDVACGDGQAGQAQGEGGVAEGMQAGAGGDDLPQDGGTIAVPVEA
jgi:hypothetical protein